MDEFSVTARCSKGFAGTAVVSACTKHLDTFSLSGCTRVCLAPADSDGYLIKEVSVVQDQFQVEVSCADGFAAYSTPQAVVCGGAKEEYSLQGCGPRKRCLAPDDVTGYLITETDLLAHEFAVSAKCDSGFVGTATVEPCASDLESYKLKGCSKR